MPVAAFRAVGSSLVPGRRTSSYQASFIVVNFIAIKIALLADDNAYLTDTPVFELLASGRAKDVSPLLSLSWILALSNAFISDVYTQSLPAKIHLFLYINKELVIFLRIVYLCRSRQKKCHQRNIGSHRHSEGNIVSSRQSRFSRSTFFFHGVCA